MARHVDYIEYEDKPIYDKKMLDSSIIYKQAANRWLGNNWLISRYLKQFLANKKNIFIIDIGTGSADLPRYLTNRLERRGISISITGIDNNCRVLKLAEKLSEGFDNIDFICGENIPIPPADYNVAILSQVLHHFPPNDVADYIRKIYEHVNDGIIISDFVNSRLAYWIVKSTVFMTTSNPISRHDGPVSVLRSYNDDEIRETLSRANINNYKIHHFFPRKIVVIHKDKRGSRKGSHVQIGVRH